MIIDDARHIVEKSNASIRWWIYSSVKSVFLNLFKTRTIFGPV